VPIKQIIDLATKKFCSEKCVATFRKENQVKCQRKQCTKPFLKIEGVSRFGRWYCSDACLNEDEEA